MFITQLLINQGANIDATNKNNITPKQLAENLGFQNIINLFPVVKEEYVTPSEFRNYTHYEDLAPTVFKNHKFPEYFQEIYALLYGMRGEKFLGAFAEHNINLHEFLTITDSRLAEIGIKFPFQRKRIHLGLIKFHGYPWHKSSIPKVDLSKNEDLFDFYLLLCGHLKHLLIINSTLNYLNTNEYIAIQQETDPALAMNLYSSLENIKISVTSMTEKIKNIQSHNPSAPVLLVDKKKINEIKRTGLFRYFRKPLLSYFSLFGCSAIVIWACFKIRIDIKQNFFKILGRLKSNKIL